MKSYEAKKIDFTKSEFQADGFKFIILKSISLDRMITYYKHAPEFTFGMDWQKIYDNNEKKMKFINDGKQGECYALCKLENEYIAGLTDKKNQHDPCMRLASIFIVREDEDAAIYDYDFQAQKFQNWRKEGIEYASFFLLVANMLPNFLNIYHKNLANISKAMETNPLIRSQNIKP